MVQGADRRRSPRVPLGVRVSGAVDKATEKLLAMGSVRDISLHGAFISLMMVGTADVTAEIQKGREIRLRFKLPGAGEPIDIVGTIARMVSKDGNLEGFGVDFVSLDATVQAAIHAYVSAGVKEL